ncbi:MAG: GHKL domain-containing protein [Desulfohalobiaceae bacterium]|nr:GHKL domain-containing protein [Desulfohalobiaceae bacterium]
METPGRETPLQNDRENGWKEQEKAQDEAHYRKLFWKFVALILLCSLVPLFLVGWGINQYFLSFTRDKILHSLETRILNHRRSIELFLRSRQITLQTLARTHSKEFLSNPENLRHTFRVLNLHYENTFTDLGIIDHRGEHLAYVGPFELIDKNYFQADWFKNVMKTDVYISDIFMGFRRSPHFVIAATQLKGSQKWILRATINLDSFEALVEDFMTGESGDVYLVNEHGVLQTTPRFKGEIMEEDPYHIPPERHAGVDIYRYASRIRSPEKDVNKQLVATTWLKAPAWMLVFRQNYQEAFPGLYQTLQTTLVFLAVCSLILCLVTVLITKYMVRVVKKRDQESDALNRQLLQAGKLAAVGELSAGVAHEINNPLGIILTEKQLLLDSIETNPDLESEIKTLISASMTQISEQVRRCKHLTQNLLRFARRTQSIMDWVDMNGFLQELVDLMKREASFGGISFELDLDAKARPLFTDASQLQQVFLNLINNALDAHEGLSHGTIRIRTRQGEGGLTVEVEDTGCGISPENRDRIFDPFFTTKPVGRGTGLGLSICYGIVKRLGGEISLESAVGQGTTFRVFLPAASPKE